MTLVSIITRTKNRPLLLKRAVADALGQKLADWEMVIVNDGGDAREVDAILSANKDAARGRIRAIHNPASLGMEAASNVALKEARGKYVVIHDDDDCWAADFLEVTAGFLEENAAQFAGVVTKTVRIVEKINGEVIEETFREFFNPDLKSLTLAKMAAANQFPPISFLYKRDALEKTGLYREDLPVRGDWEFNIRFLTHFNIAVIDRPLAFWHTREGTGAEASSVYGAADLHTRYDALIRNELLRGDLAAGRVGLGFLANLHESVSYSTGIELEIARLRQEVSGVRAEKHEALDARDREIAHLNQRLVDQDRSLNEVRAALQDSISRNQSVEGALRDLEAEREKNRKLLESTSWRVTAPLRAAKRLVSK